MTIKDALKALGKPVLLSLPRHFEKPVKVILTGAGWRWSVECGVYPRCIVQDSSGAEYHVKPEDINE